MASLEVKVKLSQFAQPFMLAAVDLLKAVRIAEDCGEDVPEDIRNAADEFERTIEDGRGEL